MYFKTKILAITLFSFTFAGTLSFAQQDSSKSHSNHNHKMEMKNDMNMDMKNSDTMQMNNDQMVSDSIVREGVIDLTLIDKNSDGKVFQDMMDWNVISDEPGRCPICNMILQEVNLDEAKQNLIENGFKIK